MFDSVSGLFSRIQIESFFNNSYHTVRGVTNKNLDLELTFTPLRFFASVLEGLEHYENRPH